ncbi:MAG: T9SS type A sorting domain-containing protein [Bacteroidales bacterium]|nr:T9SS type A sorting domain-containing protein [Bacteroidales bacterium]
MKKTLLTQFIVLISLSISFAQNQEGYIFQQCTANPNPFNPNGGYITSSGSAFTAAINEETEQNLVWRRIYSDLTQYPEVTGDASGGSCSSTDIVDNPDLEEGTCSYFRYDEVNDYFMFRLRIGQDPGSANFGYSVLIDTDELYGNNGLNADPGYIAPQSTTAIGNPGFEIEIRLKTGGSAGIYLYNVDNKTIGANTKENFSYTPLEDYTQRVYAFGPCANTVFMDFYVPASELLTLGNFTLQTPIRIVSATTTNGGTVLGSTMADLGGVEQNQYSSIEDAFDDLINDQDDGSTLPVELASFKLNTANSGSVKLSWTTASEFNTSYFIVERSQEKEGFIPVGTVQAVGFSNDINHYDFYDREALKNIPYYYRLKIVDFDGTYEYSKIVTSIFDSDQDEIVVYPNPVKQGSNITIEAGNPVTEVMLTDLTGRISIKLETTNNHCYTIPDNLPSGSYILFFAPESGKHNSKNIIVY